MTGPIRRLARDAVSPTRPTIHAMARLPYMPLPALRPIDATEMPSAGMMSAPTQMAWPAPAAMPLSGAMPAPPSQVADDALHNADDADLGARSGLRPSPPSSLHPWSSSATPFPAALMPASPTQGPSPRSGAPGAPEATHEANIPAWAAAFSTSAPAQASPEAPAPGQAAARSANARAVPDALLPPIPQDTRSARSSSAATAAQGMAGAADSAPEVHVHIGRIEVTAVQAPVAPKPSARGGRQPMSLDEYLARREGRGS